MPRRNHNAYYRNHKWPEGYQLRGPRLDASLPPQGGSGLAPSPQPSPARGEGVIFRTTGEAIVKEHREEMMRRMEKRNAEEISPVVVQEMPEHFYSLDVGARMPWYRAVRWMLLFTALGWAVVAGALLYLGIVVIAPFGFLTR